jgi:glutaredoxin
VTILLLTKRNCAFCDQAKAILARLTAEYPVSVSTLDLATSEGEALALRGGVLFPPGVFLDGTPFSYGRVSEKKLRREIERRLTVAG